ncbi:tRNA-yW synthesizing protein 5 [Nesidiocoris tenuis]|uniref:tRNA-yW synthesizing protein 5 n=1 Tax=Nesidiocoris tenuis TaxID=355587 RepID=A0ABN7AHI3_9HEMI|nr:tRNA-yW synthesizing protein 5 [Nesidiocoris tenuis]
MSVDKQDVECYNFTTKEHFQEFIRERRRPLLLKNADIGLCKEKWTVDYLAEMLGSNQVKVHVCPVGNMSFLNKNFTYKSLEFKDFIRRAAAEVHREWFLCENECYYLRSIGSDRRGRDVADIGRQFPKIAKDIAFPKLFDDEDFFSSVIRIGSRGVQIWTHYDVMDNMLIQVSGEKRVVLFSPEDTHYLYLSGDKSRIPDIDNPDPSDFPDFAKARRLETVLRPGDVLFIPALWHHTTEARTFGVGVNVFWKNLPHEMYDKTDVYGNKDLIPATKALNDINKAIQSLSVLPKTYKDFYLQRAIAALEEAKNS